MAISGATYGGTGVATSNQGYGSKYGDLSDTQSFKIQKKFLSIAKKLITFGRFAQRETKEKNTGHEIFFKRYERFAINTTPISEGVTPASDTITQTLLKTQISQYGSWVPLTDRLQDLYEDAIVQQITDRMGIQVAETLDTLAYNIAKAGTQVVYANASAASGAVTTSASTRSNVSLTIAGTVGLRGTTTDYAGGTDERSTILDIAQRALHSYDAKLISSVVKPSSGYGTEPVAEAFFAVTHPDVRRDIESLPNFSPVEKYANYGAVMAGEVGKVGSFRFIVTTLAAPIEGGGAAQPSGGNLKLTSSAVDVYPVIIFAQDAWAQVSLSGEDSIVPVVTQPRPSSEDPLGQRGAVGYSFYWGGLITQDLWMYRAEVGVSDL